jgi:hypothetical protein
MGNVSVKFNDKSIKMNNFKLLVEYDKRFNTRMNDILKASNLEVAQFVLQRSSYYVPIKTGALVNSGSVKELPDAEAEIVYAMDYAEYAYKRRLTRTTLKGRRGPIWFDRMWAEYRQDILNKYIKEVVLHYDDVEHYFIEIKLNIESMEDVVLVLDKGYKQLHSIIDIYSIDFVDSLDFIHIILDEKLSKKFKDGEETEVSLMMNSKQKFEELKKAYIIQ